MHFTHFPSQFIVFLSILFVMFLTFTFWGMSPYLLALSFIHSKAGYFTFGTVPRNPVPSR